MTSIESARQKINFTKSFLDGLSINNQRYYVSDTKVNGLRLAVFPTGIKTYFVYRKVKGRPQRIKVGRYTDITIEQARNKAVKINASISLGGDPNEEKRRKRRDLTFNELYQHYYKEHAVLNTKRPNDSKRAMELYVFPSIGSLKLWEIAPEKLKRIQIEIAETSSKSNSNRVVGIIIAVFNFAIREEYFIGINPCRVIKKFKSNKSRDRFLLNGELPSFFDALKYEDRLWQDYFLLLLYTGVRKSNLLSMRWSDVDLHLKRWRISEEETKNEDVNIVLLAEPAVEILYRRLKENNLLESPSEFVFPGEGKLGHLKDPKKSWKRIKARMQVSNLWIHDLRRTLGSYMAINGTELPIIGKALNHKSQDSTVIYARLINEPVFEAVNAAVKLMQGNDVELHFKDNKTAIIGAALEYVRFIDLIAG